MIQLKSLSGRSYNIDHDVQTDSVAAYRNIGCETIGIARTVCIASAARGQAESFRPYYGLLVARPSERDR